MNKYDCNENSLYAKNVITFISKFIAMCFLLPNFFRHENCFQMQDPLLKKNNSQF